jgi:hypothetical protein
MRTVAVISVLLATVVLCSSTGAAAATPITLVHGKRIIDIAASPRALVWRSYSAPAFPVGPHCNAVIRRLRWSGGGVRTAFRCNPESQGDRGEMVVGTSAILFTRVFVEAQGCCDHELLTHLRTPSRPGIDSSYHQFGCGGDDVGGLAARGSLAAYGRLDWTSTYCPGNPDTGTETLTGGGVYTMLLPAGQPQPLAGTPPPALLDLSTTRLALVPYDLSNPPVNAVPGELPEIQVWNLATQSLERTIAETGVIRALAVGGDQIAVMVDQAGAVRIDRFSASTGLRTTSRAISAEATPALAVSYRWIVYTVGRTIRVLNTRTNRVHTAATLAHPPGKVLAARGKAIWIAGRGTFIRAAPLS